MSAMRKIELGLVIVATAVAGYLHFIFFENAGALWRDEINSLNIANFPSIVELWRHIEFDSFPIFWLLLLRLWSHVASDSDFLYRLLGLGIGLTLLGLLWFNARVFTKSFPIYSLALLGFSPAIIRWGDSIRGYGLGICSILMTFALVWRLVKRPDAKNLILATLSALIAVQSLYYDAVLLFAICIGGFFVALKNGKSKPVVSLLIVGGVSALSLFPYLSVFQRSKSWTPMFQYPELWQGFRLTWYWQNLSATLDSSGVWTASVWVGLFAIAFAAGIFCLVSKDADATNPSRSDIAIFSMTALLVGFAGYYLFLHQLQYPTQAWYYVALIAFTAVNIEVLTSLLDLGAGWRILRISVLVLFVGLTVGPVRSEVRTRMTNVDLLATWLEQNSAPDDLIVVVPWFNGITFARNYHGAALWMTLPPMDDHRFHRVDLLQNYMKAVNQSEPVRPILEKMEKALKAGHRVWVLGKLQFLEPNQVPPLLLPAPNEASGWHDLPYIEAWSMQVAYVIQMHAEQVRPVNIPVRNPVNHFENVPLLVVEGWHFRG
jgi:hypothetical protein